MRHPTHWAKTAELDKNKVTSSWESQKDLVLPGCLISRWGIVLKNVILSKVKKDTNVRQLHI